MVNCIVIDDDQDIVEVFCELFQIINVDVLGTCNNGKDAIKLYEKHIPDIVFTDLKMPKYDGLYVIENIKDIQPNAKIIAVTGNFNAPNSNILNSLNIPVIIKPFEIDMIKNVIRDVCLIENNLPTTLQIQYKFKEEKETYSCMTTYEQYRNLKKLPIIDICEIKCDGDRSTETYEKEMQKALDLAHKNDISYIHDLSEVVIDRH